MELEKPYFMYNEDWFYHDIVDFKYKLTDKATAKAIRSYKQFYALLDQKEERYFMRIAIGGMIAAGKSSVSKEIAEEFELKLIDEFEGDDEVFQTILKWLYEGKENVEMLLQIYFIHNQWLKHKEYEDDYVVDRDVIEHWIFAQHNLKHQPEVLNMYNGLFHAYMNSIELPDHYFILDIDWDHFKERIYKRNRSVEIENFEKNKDYFKGLLKNYTDMLVAQCVIYQIPYSVINTNIKNKEEVSKFISKKIRNMQEKE
jgi:deoxyadenosine/deoxycytidine kinase